MKPNSVNNYQSSLDNIIRSAENNDLFLKDKLLVPRLLLILQNVYNTINIDPVELTPINNNSAIMLSFSYNNHEAQLIIKDTKIFYTLIDWLMAEDEFTADDADIEDFKDINGSFDINACSSEIEKITTWLLDMSKKTKKNPPKSSLRSE